MPLTALAPWVARQLRNAGLTYSEAGQTAACSRPGYHHLRHSAVIGSGAKEFAGAAHALCTWQAHLRAAFARRRRRQRPNRARSYCWAWGQE